MLDVGEGYLSVNVLLFWQSVDLCYNNDIYSKVN